LQASLKKIMTMLGRIQRRQIDNDPTFDQMCPAVTSRSTDFYKAVMVQSQQLWLECIISPLQSGHAANDLSVHRDEDFDVTENTIFTQTNQV
jgi:hypothetical protein